MSTFVFVLIMISVLAVIWGGLGYSSGNNAFAGVGGLVGVILVVLLVMFLTDSLSL